MNKLDQILTKYQFNEEPKIKQVLQEVLVQCEDWVDQNPVSYPYPDFKTKFHHYWYDSTP